MCWPWPAQRASRRAAQQSSIGCGVQREPTPLCCPCLPLPQRVGSKGPAAEVVRALVNRLAPSIISPELLRAAMEAAPESQEGEPTCALLCAALRCRPPP